MKTLNEIHNEWKREYGSDQPISPTNIDDIIWFAKAKDIKQIAVLPNQLTHIWEFLSANMGNNDTKMRRKYFIEGKCDKILGVKITILPYNFSQSKRMNY